MSGETGPVFVNAWHRELAKEQVRRETKEALRYYVPRGAQLDAHKSPAEIRIVHSPNQWGKSYWMAVEIAWSVGKIHPYRRNYVGPVFARHCCDTFQTMGAVVIPTYQKLLPRRPCSINGRWWPGLRGERWEAAWSAEARTIFFGDGSLIEFKCMRGDQRVLLPDGTWRPIQDIAIDNMVMSHDGPTKVIQTYQYDNADIYRVRIIGGRELMVTPNHVHFLANGEMKQTSELAVGDVLRIDNTQCPESGESLEEWQLGWLGILIGDGCLLRKDAGFTADAGGRVMTDLPPLPPNTYINQVAPLEYRVALIKPLVKYNPLVQFVKGLGLWGKNSYHKFVPDVVFRQSQNKKAYFLRHLWNCDGTTNEGKRQSYLTTVSRRLAYDTKYLLWSIGVNATVCEFQSKCESHNYTGTAYHVIVSGGSFDRLMVAFRGGDFQAIGISTKRQHGTVLSIERDNPCTVYCLEVDNTDHSFIVDGVVTHNSYDQEVESYEGPPRHLCGHDEEPPRNRYEANVARQVSFLPTYGMNQLFAMTPLNYTQWIYQLYQESATNPKIACFKGSLRDIPGMTEEHIVALEKKYEDPAERAARVHGEFTFTEGRVWKEYGDHNLIDPFPGGIPKEWPVYVILDPHPEKATGVLAIAENPQGIGYAFWEDEIKGDVHYICERIKAGLAGKYVTTWLIDPSSRQSAGIYGKGRLIDEFRLDIPQILEANNDRELGWEAVRKRVKNNPPGGPKLFIFRSCPKTHFQMQNYSWKPPMASGEHRNKPEVVKRNDELCDCIRYWCMHTRMTQLGGESFDGFQIGMLANG